VPSELKVINSDLEGEVHMSSNAVETVVESNAPVSDASVSDVSNQAQSIRPHADAIAQDLAALLKDKMDQPRIDAALAALKETAVSYAANASWSSFIFYVKLYLNVTSGITNTFDGNAGGIALPGGGASAGTLYLQPHVTQELLYKNTASFSLVGASAYLGIQLWNSQGYLMAHYEGGGVPGAGAVGGTGSWSHQ
jgi:hypothetical protein